MGRAVHIHVKVHLGSAGTYTGQLFFDEGVLADAYTTEPYSARGAPDTSNASDGIFGQSGGRTILAVTPGEAGHTGAVTLGVQVAPAGTLRQWMPTARSTGPAGTSAHRRTLPRPTTRSLVSQRIPPT